MPLYGVAIVEHPTKKQVEEGAWADKLVFGPAWVTARDPQTAAIAVVAGNSSVISGLDMAKCEVLVSPFV
jgi:hypothetical protein